MTTTVWILGDQLKPQISSLTGLLPADCVILMIESRQRARQLPYHKQKLVFLWSAMRHFAEELRQLGYTVDYYEAQPHFKPALAAHLDQHQSTRVRLMESAEYGGAARLAKLAEAAGVQAELTPNNMFISDRDEFDQRAKGKKSLTLSLVFRRAEETLRHEQVDEHQEKILEVLNREFQAQLRA